MCPKCGTSVDAGEKFCTRCGVGVSVTEAGVVAQDPIPTAASFEASAKMGTARKWLLAISIITLVSGFIFYAIQKSDVDKQIRDAEAATAGMDPAERDQLMVRESGMTFQQAVDHDRGMVTMLLVTNIGLSVVYLGLWFWAKRQPFTASVVALLLFLTVIIIGAVLDPKTLAQGIIVKGLFIAALAKAISAGNAERRLVGTT